MIVFYLIFFTLLSVLVIRFKLGARVEKPVALLLAVHLILISIFYFVDSLSGDGFDESVVYHLAYGLDEAGVKAFAPQIGLVLALIALSVVGAIFLYGNKANSSRRPEGVAPQSVVIFGLIFLLPISPLVKDLRFQWPIIRLALFDSVQLDDGISKFRKSKIGQLVQASPLSMRSGDRSIVGKKNVIWIYGESLERTYFNQSAFGLLLPNLSELAPQARRYTSISQPWGTGWTIGGIVGSQCGLPLVTLGAKNVNSLANLKEFMPGARCMGDLLKDQGYRLEYIGGASGKFAGKGNFLISHGYSKIWDRDALAESFDTASAERNEWGYYDDFVLSVLQRRALDLHKSEKPFVLNALTLDTHSPNGFLSPACRKNDGIDRGNPIASAVSCSDLLLGEFVRWFMGSSLYRDTVLVISSDHLSMPNSLQSKLDSLESERHLLFWVFGSDVVPGEISSPGSTFDIGPTVLGHMLGVGKGGIGLGRNLDVDQTLFGREFSSADLASASSGIRAHAWREVLSAKKLVVHSRDAEFSLGSEFYPYPALVHVDDGMFTGVSWIEKERRERYIDLIASERESDYVWLDNCGWSGDERFWGSQDSCAHFIRGGKIVGSKSIESSGYIELEVEEFLEFESLHSKNAKSVSDQFYALSVSGPGHQAGLLGQRTIASTRGVSVFTKEQSGAWAYSNTIDLCEKNGPKTLDDVESHHGSTLAVVVKDSAHCGNIEELRDLAKSLGLEKLADLEFRQPYVGFLDRASGVRKEFAGSVGAKVIVPLP